MEQLESLPPHSTLAYKNIEREVIYFDIYPPTMHSSSESDKTIAVPAVVYFHAGGLTVGGRASWFPFWLHRRTVDSGFAFLCPDYQLLPPATGHNVFSDVHDFMSFLGSKNVTFTASVTETQSPMTCTINMDALLLAGSSAGGLCAYLGASAHPRPKALLSLYGMGGDFMTPYWLEPKHDIFIPGREILDPEDFKEFVYPFSLPITTESMLQYHPAHHATPGLPANPRMYLARLYCQLGTYLDYYTGEHEPSLSKALREQRQEILDGNKNRTPEEWGELLVPESHRSLFPQLSVTSEWPEVFLIHGTEDYHVLFRESLHLKELLEKVNVKVTLKAVEGKGHSFDYDSRAEEEFKGLFDEVGDFLKRVSNPGPP